MWDLVQGEGGESVKVWEVAIEGKDRLKPSVLGNHCTEQERGEKNDSE